MNICKYIANCGSTQQQSNKYLLHIIPYQKYVFVVVVIFLIYKKKHIKRLRDRQINTHKKNLVIQLTLIYDLLLFVVPPSTTFTTSTKKYLYTYTQCILSVSPQYTETNPTKYRFKFVRFPLDISKNSIVQVFVPMCRLGTFM